MANALYAQALAEIQALRPDAAAEPAVAPSTPSCCTGDRRGYQWHQRNGVPACETSKSANNEYMTPYLRDRRQQKRRQGVTS